MCVGGGGGVGGGWRLLYFFCFLFSNLRLYRYYIRDLVLGVDLEEKKSIK